MKSDNIKQGIARTPHRGLLMATGVSRKNMKAPFIGIASSFSKKQRFSFHPDENNTPDETSQVHRKIHPPLLSVISCKFTGKKLPPPLLGSQTLRFSGSFRLYVLLLPSKLSRQSTILPLPFRSKHPRKR